MTEKQAEQLISIFTNIEYLISFIWVNIKEMLMYDNVHYVKSKKRHLKI